MSAPQYSIRSICLATLCFAILFAGTRAFGLGSALRGTLVLAWIGAVAFHGTRTGSKELGIWSLLLAFVFNFTAFQLRAGIQPIEMTERVVFGATCMALWIYFGVRAVRTGAAPNRQLGILSLLALLSPFSLELLDELVVIVLGALGVPQAYLFTPFFGPSNLLWGGLAP